MKQKSNLSFEELTAVSPLDGRYHDKTKELAEFISEYALIRTRVEIEAKYLVALSEQKIIRHFTPQEKKELLNFDQKITLEIAQKVKEIEKETRHDVKAMERTMRMLLKGTTLEDVIEMLHLGLTSEDVNNISQRLLLYRATQDICLPLLQETIIYLTDKAEEYKSVAMLARTHGQAAVPTTLGKELIFYANRLHTQIQKLKIQKLTGKLNGAVGNFNALYLAYPQIDWMTFSEKFISSLGLIPNLITIQINPYDDMAEYFQIYQRINTILIDMDQDVWRYVSDGWFGQVAKKGEVGSSTMPQKVNPIDFENSEGNLGLANSLFEFFVRKLMISRLQRDLSDSTVIRNSGAALGYCLLGYKSLLTGLSRIKPNLEQIDSDLQKDWIILTEGVQTVLRKAGVEDPYSMIATLSRGKHINRNDWEEWIDSLPIEKKEKKLLRQLTPHTYIGLAVTLTEKGIQEIRKNSK